MTPDTKDWTWVLERPCPDCGVDVSAWQVADLPATLHDAALAWGTVLTGAGAASRPQPDVWSPLEYACHVRDVHRRMGQRLGQMLSEHDPEFANWDQEATALEDDYLAQDAATVDAELVEVAAAVAAQYASVTGEQLLRPGRRSDGSRFTVLSLGRYHLHDVLHHLHDVGLPVPPGPRAR